MGNWFVDHYALIGLNAWCDISLFIPNMRVHLKTKSKKLENASLERVACIILQTKEEDESRFRHARYFSLLF